jgi:hypothetical protein
MGILGLFVLVESWVQSRSYESWLSTQGEITYSEIVSGIGCGPGNTMSSMVIYAFEAGGVKFSSFNISKGMDDIKCGTDLVDEYPEGKKVTVYYNPENPRDSVLKLTQPNVFFSAFIAFLLIDMIVIGYFGCRGMRQENQGE